MRSFLGVPIVARGEVIGALYLTDKEGADDFDDDDQRVIEMLAAHAAIAIENARLHERSRELSIVEERNRLARELHDAVSQKLFGVVLTAESAATLLGRDGDAAREQLTRLGGLAREALEELRSLIVELRPPSLAAEGLATALRKHVDVLRRVFDVDVDLRVAGAPHARRRRRGRGVPDRPGGAAQRAAPRARRARRGPAARPTTAAWRSRWPTTASASRPPTPSCAAGGSA